MKRDGLVVIIILLSLAGVSQAQPPHFQVVDLGTFFPTFVRANGTMTGSLLVGEQMAARGTVGHIENLEALGVAWSQNAGGSTVGYSGCYDAGCINQEATLWRSDGVAHLLGLLLGGYASAATGINNAGTIVGYGDDAQLVVHALRWQGSSLQVLPGLGGDTFADSINTSGVTLGTSETPQGTPHAVLWTAAGTLKDLGTLGGTMSIGYGLNDAGTAVGWSTDSDGRAWPFRYTPSAGMQALQTPTGMVSCIAEAINNLGQMAGSCDPGLGYPAERAIVWTANGAPYNLNTLLVNGTGWVIEYATSISSSGLIVGAGTYQGRRHGVLVMPAPAKKTPDTIAAAQ